MSALSAACYPTLPPHLAEGTDVLGPGHVNLNIAGGVAPLQGKDATGTWDNQFAAGFEARVRVGLPEKQEIGVSFIGGMATSMGRGDPPFALGGKLSYKVAPFPWLAFVAGGGVMSYSVAAVALFSGDLAVILAPYTAKNGNQFYVGAKGAFSVPVLQNATNVNEALILPMGFGIQTSKRVRVFIEWGAIAGFAQQSNTAETTRSLGGYGIVALAFVLR